MKLIFTSLAILVAFFAVTFVVPMGHLHAQDVIQLGGNQEIVMSGTITDLDSDSFVLKTADTSATVALNTIQKNASVENLLKEGMKVTVRGTLGSGSFNEPLIQAASVAAYQDDASAATP